MADTLSPQIITPPQSSGGFLKKGTVFGLLVLVFLVSSIGIGLILLGQEQDIRSKAAADFGLCTGGTCDCAVAENVCGQGQYADKPNCYVVYQHCDSNSAANCTDDAQNFYDGSRSIPDTGCGTVQIDMACEGANGTDTIGHTSQFFPRSCTALEPIAPGDSTCSGDCFGPVYNGVAVENCGSVGRPTGQGSCPNGQLCCAPPTGGTPPTTTSPGLCDDNCNSDSDCAAQSPAGALLTCHPTLKRCVNQLCPNDTNIGNNCDCKTPVQTCGEPCGGGYPLCGTGYTCVYTTGATNCTTSTSNPRAHCVPLPAPTGYSLPKCTSGDTGNSYLRRSSDGKSAWTQAEIIQELCQAPATPPPSVTETQITAQCLAVKIYDQNWDSLTTAEFSQLTEGTVVRFAVGGTTTGGAYQAARFTINGVLRPPVATKVPGKEEFYDEYTIPDISSFAIKGELMHSSLGWF